MPLPAELIEPVLLALGGVVAGFVNTLAGGGSLIMVPALMLAGLPADVANGTSRVAIVAQCATGTVGYARAGRLDRAAVRDAVPITVAGALAGAYVSTLLPARIFEPLLLGTMLVVALALFLRPESLAPPPGTTPRPAAGRPLALLALLAAGFYGGLLQAGVGIVLLAILGGLLRHDLVRANALKVTIVLIYSLAALAIFVWRGKVAWAPAVAITIGNVAGAHLGVKMALRGSARSVRAVIFVAVIGICAAVVAR